MDNVRATTFDFKRLYESNSSMFYSQTTTPKKAAQLPYIAAQNTKTNYLKKSFINKTG